MDFLTQTEARLKLENLQPLDRVALLSILFLTVLMGLLLWSGDRTYPKVRNFSWQNQQVGINDTAFVLAFNRPMNWESVAANLSIKPPLPGKLSWSGRRLAYTLTQPIPYGQTFQLELDQATAAQAGQTQPRVMQPFRQPFHSRDLAFVYLGIAGPENGRLALKNLTQKTQQLLTPPNLTVLKFKVDSSYERVLFTALDRTDPTQTIFEASLYTASLKKPGNIQLLLDNAAAQILKFDVTPDGRTTVVQRYGREKDRTISLSILAEDGSIRQVANKKVDGDFVITPDGQTAAVSQNQGVNIVSLVPDAPPQPVRFLPQFNHALSFARDGTAALMVKENEDATQSLFWVPNEGTEQQLLTTAGDFFDAQLDPNTQTVYCLYSEFNPDANFRSDLQLNAISLKTGSRQVLKTFPGQATGHLSLAPDYLGLLFEEISITDQIHPSVVRNIVGQTITDSKLWLLPLTAEAKSPQPMIKSRIVASGIQPAWIP
ncbi:MAG: hypothetical protein WA902_19120 [Thermosynechococcaceae cyanobacterium]